MVLQKILFHIFLDNLRYTFRIILFVLNIIYRVLRDQLYHNLGLSIEFFFKNLLRKGGSLKPVYKFLMTNGYYFCRLVACLIELHSK